MGISRSSIRVGFDVGGTFTDFVLVRGSDVFVRKVPSTPPGFDRAILATLPAWCRELGIDPADVTELVHGTTASENIVLQAKGATVGLLTTAGFEDVLEIGRGRHTNRHDPRHRRRPPLVERRLRLGVRERVDALGAVLLPLDRASAEAVIARLANARVDAVAICLLHSYRNPKHERELAHLVREHLPEVPVSISSELSGRLGEFERTTTTVVDAYVKPEMNAYIARLTEGLRERGFRAPLFIVQANGSMMPAAGAMLRPLLTIGSGPAAGVAGAAWVGRDAAVANLLAFDMGGTTAKASALADLRIPHQSEYEIGGEATGTLSLTRGGDGYLVRLPAIEVAEVGAGGGSIARVEGGVLKVGPRSAGAVPGPICYAKGGREPTVTDANAALGYLNPRGLLGGGLPLDVPSAREAIDERIARPMGTNVEDAAFSVVEIANAEMVRALSAVTYHVGKDASQFTMLAYGGGGAVHAVALAREMGMPRVLVPLRAGLFSAVGMLVSPTEYEQVHSVLRGTRALDLRDLNALLETAEENLRRLATAGGNVPDALAVVHSAECQYHGQSGTLELELAAPATTATIEALRVRFAEEHRKRFGFVSDDEIDVASIRTVLHARTAASREIRLDDYVEATPAPESSRRAYFGPRVGWIDAAIHSRSDLRGRTVEGPAIIEELDTTVVLPPGCRATLDERSNIDIAIGVGPADESVSTWSKDPRAVRVEKLRLAVEAAAERGTATIRLTARSPLAKFVESNAYIGSHDGEVMGDQHHGRAFPLAVLERFGDKLAPGDVYVTNDPYIGAGHLPHIDAARPVFVDSEFIGLALVSGHQVDMGGIAPGSMSAQAIDTFQEGLLIPVVALYEGDRPNQTLHELIAANVRAPQTVLGDINGLVAALRQVEQEMIAIARRFGSAAAYREAVTELLATSEAAARAAIGAMPDGAGEWTEPVDYDLGGTPAVVSVRIEKSGTDLSVDFTGTSAQVPRAFNSTWAATTFMAAGSVLQNGAGRELPRNTGTDRPVRVSAPIGCMLNPRPPGAAGARAVSVQPMFLAILGAMSFITPDLVPAAAPKQEAAITFAGTGADGAPFVHMEQLLGTSGATAFADGTDAFGNRYTRNNNVPVEQCENEMPLRIERYRLAPDSGGPGTHRGGLGIERAFRVLIDDVTMQLRGSRDRSSPWGLRGGLNGAPSVRYVERASGEVAPVAPTEKVRLDAGDLFVYRSCGAGGFGPPEERSPEAVRVDLENGKITPEHATVVYGLREETVANTE